MDPEDEYNESTWTYLNLCVEPTIFEGLKFAKDLLIANIVLRLIIQYVSLPHNVRHSLSLVIGSLLLYYNIGQALVWTIGLTVGSYICILLLSYISIIKWKGFLVSFGIILLLLCCEFYIVNPKMWQQIRGIQMIVAMKIISVAIEFDRGMFKQMLNPVEFGGYILCPANCVLGPWISFNSYNNYLNIRFLSKKWLKNIAVNLVLAITFLVLSNCIVPWYIDDESSRWLVAYRDAQAFRMSHYFVSSMSMVSMISAGFGMTNDCHTEVKVTKPYFVEFPRSLVQVVVYWNIPMHQWLKNYVFKPFQPYGHFGAIFVTYTVSSVLHGFNFQLSAVLISVGAFSYVEYNFRSKVALALEVCCLANPCLKQCGHNYKSNSWLARFLNSLFSLMTIVHLAYLGVMFEASFSIQESGYSYHHTMSKWEDLNFFSHGFIGFLYLVFLAL